jgi:hypothetical protein
MKIHETIKAQLLDAMRAKDTVRLNVIRGLLSSFSYEMIAKKSKDEFLDDESVLGVIRKSVKQHKDSIEQFEKGDRKDLAKKEKAELVLLEVYLPQMMSKDDIKKIVKKKIASEGEIDKKKIGQFLGQLMKELKGKADGADVKAVVDELLN